MLAIEVVSESNPHKDYAIAPDKYAASGTRELWIFDPLLSGPSVHGGPHRLQVWHREGDDFVRIYAGEGPFRSPTLEAHLVVSRDHRRLRVADDARGRRLWPTAEEAERLAKEAARAAEEQARAAEEQVRAAEEQARAAEEQARAAEEAERLAKEAALARIRELERELRRRGASKKRR